MILLSESSVYTLRIVERSYIHEGGKKAKLQSEKFLVLTKIGDCENSNLGSSSPLENREKREAHEAEIYKDGTVHFGVVNFEAAISEPWLTVKCDPSFLYARFLSETSIYELRIIDEKIEIKRLAKFWPTRGDAPVGEIIRGDKIYANAYGTLIIYEEGEEIENLSISEFL